MRKLTLVLAVMGLIPAVHAQQRGAAVTSFSYVSSVEADTIKGAPYSAEVINESSQTLSDGNRILRRSTWRVYRDGEGRTRREEDRPSISPAIIITDPVTDRSWSLDVDNRVARQSAALLGITSLRLYNPTFGRNGDLAAERVNVFVNGQLSAFRVGGGRGGMLAPSAEQYVEERLAPQTIEGVRVEGVRRTTTIAAGAIGNERPIVVTSEEWTSPELKALVLSESSDPRTGVSSYKLVGLKRGEPPASLFQVPPDYQVVQAPGPGAGRGARGGLPPR